MLINELNQNFFFLKKIIITNILDIFLEIEKVYLILKFVLKIYTQYVSILKL